MFEAERAVLMPYHDPFLAPLPPQGEMRSALNFTA